MAVDHNGVLILCDFDGTASTVDVGHQLLKKFSEDRWETIDRQYCAGAIGSMEAYTKIASVISASEREFLEYLGSLIQLDRGFAGFYRFCVERGIDLKIVSDGLDFYIQHILAHYQLDEIPFFSNRLIFRNGRGIEIEFPAHNPECNKCGTCKKSILERHRKCYQTIIYIGDGVSDICPSRYADLVFGKNILYGHHLKKGLPCIHYQDFREIREYLENTYNEITGTKSDQTMGHR